jgi:hypothetical protein
MPNADIAGNGAVWVGIEPTYGTPADPSAAGVGVWVPIISETLKYTEAKYYSPQIRQSAIVSDVAQSYYHVEGDIVMEVDANFLPYFLYASRHTVAKTGTGPYTYAATPTNVGSTYPGGSAKGLSIATIRNSIGFLYSGCVVNNWAWTIENGVLRVTMGMIGLAEVDLAGTVTESWVDPHLFGADAHSIYVDAAGTAPTFGAGRDNTFNGFTFNINYNGAAQNRIVPDRSATFVSYGETEATYDTELDFTSKAEYNNMKANTLRSLKLESLRPGGSAATFGAATEAVQIIVYRSNYDQYDVGLSGIGDLLMARVTGRSIGISGGVPYKITCKSAANIT